MSATGRKRSLRVQNSENAMGGELADAASVTGRIMLGGVFLFGGIEHAFIWKSLVEVMGRRGVPAPLAVLTIGSSF